MAATESLSYVIVLSLDDELTQLMREVGVRVFDARDPRYAPCTCPFICPYACQYTIIYGWYTVIYDDKLYTQIPEP